MSSFYVIITDVFLRVLIVIRMNIHWLLQLFLSVCLSVHMYLYVEVVFAD